MSTIVVYKSISGFTKKYAKWIADDLKSDCIDLKNLRANMIDQHTTIVFGASLHAVGISGYKKLKKILIASKYRELVLFAVGASPKKDGIEKEIADSNLKTYQDKLINLFYFRGGFDYSKLNISNKILMALLKIKIRIKGEGERTSDEKGMLASYEKPFDATKYENVKELVAYVLNLK